MAARTNSLNGTVAPRAPVMTEGEGVSQARLTEGASTNGADSLTGVLLGAACAPDAVSRAASMSVVVSSAGVCFGCDMPWRITLRRVTGSVDTATARNCIRSSLGWSLGCCVVPAGNRTNQSAAEASPSRAMCTATDTAHETSVGRFAGNGVTRGRVVRAGVRVMRCTLVPVNEAGVSHDAGVTGLTPQLTCERSELPTIARQVQRSLGDPRAGLESKWRVGRSDKSRQAT